MAYKINSNTVIDGSNTSITGNFLSGVGLTVKNDSGEIHVQDTSPMVGTVAGYSSGGYFPGASPYVSTRIDKFPFATDTNATNVGSLTQGRYRSAGHSSTSFGYVSGGYTASAINNIDKFPFAINNNATDVGDLTQTRYFLNGQSSATHGYSSGGLTNFPPAGALNTVDRFPFSSDSNANDVGDLTQIRQGGAGNSSATDGFTSGGNLNPSTFYNTIDRFPFATNANASDVGDLTQSRSGGSGQSSSTHGYVSGGANPGIVNTIDRFLFSSSTNATDVGDLASTAQSAAGQSSITSGYVSVSNSIDKFPFSATTNATNIGGLSQTRTRISSGQQD